MSDDQEQDEVECGPASAGHDAVKAAAAAAFNFEDRLGRMPGIHDALGHAGNGLLGGEHAARLREDLLGRHPGLAFDAATAGRGFDAATAGRGFDFTRAAGMSTHLESISERVSEAAKSWMTSVGGAHSGVAAAAAAFNFEDRLGRMPGIHDALGHAGNGLLGGEHAARLREDLLGRHPGLAFDAAKLAGADPHGGVSGLAGAAALKFDDGVGRLSGVQAAMDAMAGPGLSGLLGGEHAARFGMNWASEELGRHLPGLTGLMGVGGAMSDHVSIFDKVMGDSQRAMNEALGRWSSLMGPTSWMTDVMRGPAESIADTMRGWSTLADGGLWAARLALRMALAAKRAVTRGDIDAVKRFLCDWLGFKFEFVTPDLVNSASLVLLDERAWLPDDVLALDYDPCPKLRKLTLAEHRSCTRLIIDPRLRAHHQPVASLNKPITKADADSDSSTTLLDLVIAKPQPDLAAANDDINDPRVLRVLAKLTDRERKIAEERGHVGTTWAEAAVACGGTADEGEKLRRKVKRLSKSAGSPAAAACRRPDATRGSVSARAVAR